MNSSNLGFAPERHTAEYHTKFEFDIHFLGRVVLQVQDRLAWGNRCYQVIRFLVLNHDIQCGIFDVNSSLHQQCTLCKIELDSREELDA